MAPGDSLGRRDAPDPREEGAFAGLGSFSLKVAIATAIAVVIAAGALRLYGASGGMRDAADRAVKEGVRAPPEPSGVSAARPPVSERSPASAAPPAAPPALSPPVRPRDPASSAAAEVALDVERRRAAGALREAVKRFAPCPGGDVRRTASIDGDRVVKLAREREDGAVLEEWFDRDGRLRQATVRGRATAPARTLLLDEAGRTLLDEAAAEGAGDARALPLDRRDPSAAFFGGPGCAR
jgi:hypothetical protein